MDVVAVEGAIVLESLICEDEPLLIRRDALLVVYLLLHILDGIAGLNVQSRCLAS